VKREYLVQELIRAGCVLKRHGHKRDIFINPQNGRLASVLRHREIKERFSVD